VLGRYLQDGTKRTPPLFAFSGYINVVMLMARLGFLSFLLASLYCHLGYSVVAFYVIHFLITSKVLSVATPAHSYPAGAISSPSVCTNHTL
jgi:hypothetical protein